MSNREENQVFSGSPTTHQAQQVQTQQSEIGTDIPTEMCPLPSNGLVYPRNSSLFGRDALEIRPMTTREEDILTSKALIKKGTVITELIKSCVVDKSIDVANLIAGDRAALMVAIRITGYGPEYEVEIQCPECEAKTKRVFNLAELPIQRLTLQPVSEGENAFLFTTPSKKEIVFKFMTGRDEEDITALAEKQKKLGITAETNVTSTLFKSILSVDGVTDRQKISNYVKTMAARDSNALRSFIKKNEPGMLMKQESVCNACGNRSEVDMPLGVSFFWPSAE
jgi:hypothetical protein